MTEILETLAMLSVLVFVISSMLSLGLSLISQNHLSTAVSQVGYEYQDARTYAEWGVDYLKYDWCHTGNQSAPDSYRLMKIALVQAGRPIVFSICEWGASQPWTWAPEVGNLWRTTFDIRPCWDCGEPYGQ